ncbi:MAG: alpha-glucan family phosphorylase [Myxococcales bacterium]|nr:alpha-glucan family phosphorylase [Myxococcales bacterium]
MLPERLNALDALANNLWWSWDPEATRLWHDIDPLRFRVYHHNPVALLHDVEASRWEELAADPGFLDRLDGIHRRFRAYLAASAWGSDHAQGLMKHGVGYISMEFGLHVSLRLYSGGLGVLAGDHLRSASDLGIPLVGFSLLYRHGYFRQVIDDGRQLAAYPASNFERLPVKPCLGADGAIVEIEVPNGDRRVIARVWQLDVGRCRLLLLDTEVDANHPDDRCLTHHLYGGDEKLRIRQEVLLGFGAVATARALGLDIGVWHLNEGHCAFAPIALVGERTREGETFEDACAKVRQHCVFTTHTPVPAGHDRFHEDLVRAVLGDWCDEAGLDCGDVVDLGRVSPGDQAETLCVTVVALRLAAASNGVSELHGHVSREMWTALWPERAAAEVPIGHVTNGVHAPYWTAPEMQALFDEWLPGWRVRPWDPEVWARIEEVPDEALWDVRNRLRLRLVQLIGTRGHRSFDPNALTIGFARRFAPYKRGNLVFRDPMRLKRLLEDHDAQLVFSGKAHPRDEAGKEIVAEVVRVSETFDFRERVVLLTDYDMYVGRVVTSGADVWLNNPRRPHEASGTSGQKVVLNGGLNLSVLDGWWPEGFDGTNGWAIGDGQEWQDEPAQDVFDAESLYTTLEQQVVREWEDRDASGLPHTWLKRVRRSIGTCAPKFTSDRMVRDYVLSMYLPHAR